MTRRKKIYEGKAKILYEGPEPGTVIQYFKDDATTFNAEKKAVIDGKGVLNNRISAHLMTQFEIIGITTHFILYINMREQLVREVEIIPIEVVVRNVAAGTLTKRLGLEDGTILPRPLLEYYYKKDELGDPLVGEDHIFTFGWADPFELEEMSNMAWRVNDFLKGLFAGIGLRLIDFKIEFGRIYGEHGELYLVLADEMSPDNCRLWDAKTGERMDKDRFRFDLGNLIEGYQHIAEKLGLIPEGGIIKGGEINEQLAEKLDQIENELANVRRLKNLKAPKPQKV
ncbi:MAG: phosphoribosylaminoimidazolesuccinocarboxamide synthase [Pseudomonadota bacterium]